MSELTPNDIDLIPGHFYWVIPELDPGTDHVWERGKQPARFSGLRDDGTMLWHCLNISGESDWPMRWIGPEIIP